MQITSIGIFPNYNINIDKAKVTGIRDKWGNSFLSEVPKDTFVQNIPFTANYIKTFGEYRELTKNHEVHCFYCRRLLLYSKILQDMLEKGVFSSPVKDFVEKVAPYRKYMKEGPQEVFDNVVRLSKTSPQTHLSEIIQYLYHESINKLIARQTEIFNEITEKSKELPPHIQSNFKKFLEEQHNRLHEIPHYEEFSPQKFAYKMSHMIISIPNKELRKYLSRITSALSNPAFDNRNNIIPYEIGSQISRTKYTRYTTAQDFSEYVIRRVKTIAERLNRKDIIKLCETSQRMIDKKPVVVRFSNKEFMADMAKAQLAEVRSTPVYYDMTRIAKQLPSSANSNNSFVVKYRDSDSDTIGYKLMESVIATVEHLIPQSDGGSDLMTNIVLACKGDNNKRGSKNLYLQLSNFPPENPQAYFDDIIEIANKEHLFDPADIEGAAKTVLTEGYLGIDTSKLKS